MYSVKEAAKNLGVSERHLRLLLKRGDIEGKKLGRDWIVLSLAYERKREVKGGKK
ncbi:helix-turn-helix domain-containing protein [Chloroflexota bacterium]